LSNAREKESIQLFFPGENEDFPNIKMPLYLYSLEFDFIGKLTQLHVIQNGFDFRNSHSSIVHNGLNIQNCQMGKPSLSNKF
jgi:hypothetical protein